MYLNKSIVDKAINVSKDNSQVVVDLSLKQLLNLSDLDKFLGATNPFKLLLSTNYLKEVDPALSKFNNLQELDLSINHIGIIQNLNTLTNLTYLNLSNNRILKIEGLGTLANLQVLDLSMNYITRIENLRNKTLITLILSGNNITELENLHHLKALQNLELEKNQISNCDSLAVFKLPNLKSLVMSYNQISLDYLEDMIKILKLTPSIEEITLIGNEITLHKKYKTRMMELSNIKVLDKLALKDPIKKHYEKLQNDDNLEQMVQESRKEYLDRLNRETSLKEGTLEMIEKQKKNVEQMYDEYEKALLEDFDLFYDKVKELKLKRLNGEMNEYDTQRAKVQIHKETLQEWKRKMKLKVKEKKELFDEAVRNQIQLQQEYLESKISGETFQKKLYDIAMKNPEVWRDIKLRERDQYLKEEADAQREKKKYLENVDDSEMNQYETLANQIQASMIKDIADTVLEYEAKEMQQQRQKASNVLKHALLNQMVSHYANMKKGNVNQDIEELSEDQEESKNSDQPFIPPKVSEEELREMLQKEYQDGKFKKKPKEEPQQPQPQDLRNETLDNLLQLQKGNTSKQYSDSVRDKIQKKSKKNNNQGAPANPEFDQLKSPLSSIKMIPDNPPIKRQSPDLISEDTYVNPKHIGAVKKNGDKVIMVPFPDGSQPTIQTDKKSNKKALSDKQNIAQPAVPDVQSKKVSVPQNVLDDLDKVDDNGLPAEQLDIPEYQLQNRPYQIYNDVGDTKKSAPSRQSSNSNPPNNQNPQNVKSERQTPSQNINSLKDNQIKSGKPSLQQLDNLRSGQLTPQQNLAQQPPSKKDLNNANNAPATNTNASPVQIQQQQPQVQAEPRSQAQKNLAPKQNPTDPEKSETPRQTRKDKTKSSDKKKKSASPSPVKKSRFCSIF